MTGDLGGGSLELVAVNDYDVGEGITLPLGGLRLQDMSNEKLTEATKISHQELAKATLLEAHQGEVFYAVGGTWRNLAKLHMTARNYPCMSCTATRWTRWRRKTSSSASPRAI